MLGTMEADYAAAQERLSQASVDEPSLARLLHPGFRQVGLGMTTTATGLLVDGTRTRKNELN